MGELMNRAYPLTAEERPVLYSRAETRGQSPPDRASRAIWALGRAYSAVRGDSRRTTPLLAPATAWKTWPPTRWRIEPPRSTLPFRSPTDHARFQDVSAQIHPPGVGKACLWRGC
jgi:hypothetical protein